MAETQYGFRNGRSTEDAITLLVDTVGTTLDKGKKCVGVFLDLAKAFDTVSRRLLLKKLEAIGIRGVPLEWFRSYLCDRKQRIKLAGYTSDYADILFGVPQGSVLGPTLFLVYINDLCQLNLIQARLFVFADDTAIIFQGDNWNRVIEVAQEGLRRVTAWLDKNLLSLNISKTKAILFRISNKSAPKIKYSIKLHNCKPEEESSCSCPVIEEVNHVKYLGIYIDNKLSWGKQIDCVSGRVRKMMIIFKRLKHVADDKIKKIVYTSICQSVLQYGIVVWGAAVKTKLIKVERAQRALLKVAYNKTFRYPTDLLYQDCKHPRVRQLFIIATILRFHKTALKTNSNRGDRRIYWRLPRTRTAYGHRLFSFTGPYIYSDVNYRLNILHMTRFTVKKALQAWLSNLDYKNTEDLLSETV